jgi:hypothetical protein
VANAAYDVRFTILRRTILDRTAENEPREDWPDPPAGNDRYTGKRLALSAGEDIGGGLQQSTGTIKLEIKGQKIPIAAVDRVRLLDTGRVYRITADPVRTKRTTIITIESIQDGR